MLWLWILLGLAVGVVLLSRLRLGIELHLDDTLTLTLRLGPIHIQLLPAKEKKSSKPKKPKQPKEKKPFPKPTFSDVRDALRTILPALYRALLRVGRDIRLDPLQLNLVLGGDADPADTALLYSRLQSAVWTLMPAAEQLLNIPSPAVHLGLDFSAPATRVSVRAGISLRLGTLLAVLWTIAVPSLRWLRRFLQSQKTAGRPQTAKPPDPTSVQAAAPVQTTP